MRSVYFLSLICAFALTGCAQRASNLSAPDRLAQLNAQLQDLESQSRDLVMRHYYEWQNENPRTCDSQALKQAAGGAIFTIDANSPESVGAERMIHEGGWALDIADGARASGCDQVAKRLYEHIISTYVGFAYSGLRDRAMLGLSRIKG